jgi:mitotic spindle assembly checkpoint protein MAD2
LKQLVLVITEADTKEVLERWTFDIDTNKDVVEGRG